MIDMQAYVHGFSLVDHSGIHANGTVTPWNTDNTDPREIRRSMVYSSALTSFGKLNIPDKMAFSAASLICCNREISDPRNTGITLATAFGSLSTDIRYMESVVSSIPRPAFFSATLPSSPVAEIAIIFKLQGPNRVFIDQRIPAFTSIEGAMRMLEAGKSDSILCIWARGIDKRDESGIFAEGSNTRPESGALLLNNKPDPEKTAFLLTVSGDSTRNSMQTPMKESYFHDIIHAMEHESNISLNVDTPGFSGDIALTKDY